MRPTRRPRHIPLRHLPWTEGLICLLLLLSSALAQSSSPYRLRWKLDAPLTLGSTSLTVIGHLYQRRIAPLPTADLLALDRADVPAFDRVATYAWHPQAADLSDVGLLAGMAAPLGLLTARSVRHDWPQYLLLWWQALSLTDGLTTWTKSLTLRPRPFAYYFAAASPDVPPAVQQAVGQADARFAYFSGHTSITAASTFFAARAFADYFPDAQARPWVWAGAALLPALVGFWRVRAGKHYPTDVLTGYLVGASIGWLIPALHRR